MINKCPSKTCTISFGQKQTNAAGIYQDGKYGEGRRVFTEGKTMRCTVCGHEEKNSSFVGKKK